MTTKAAPNITPIDSPNPCIYIIQTHAKGPAGQLPFDEEILLHSPSGDIFALSQNAGTQYGM